MNFINYSLLHPEPKTLKAHWHHFPSAGLTPKTLPFKPIRLHHQPSLPSLPARSNHFFCVQSTSLATSLSSQFPPAPSQTHPLSNRLPSSTSLHKHRSYQQNQSPIVLLNDFDRVFDENGIVDGFVESEATDLTTDIISCSDGGAEDETWKGRNQEQEKDASAALESFSSAMAPRPALVPERLGDGTSITLPASEEHPGLMELNRETDGTRNHEWSHSSPDAPIMIEAEMRTENISAARGSTSSACSPELYRHKCETVAHKTAQRETAPSGPHCLFEAEPMQSMVAVVVPSISRCHREDAATLRGDESGKHVERAPRSRESVAVTDRSVSSTSSQSVASTGGFQFEHALNPRLLSPEDIFALVSAFVQKLLDLRRDSSTDTWRTMVQTESVSVGEDQRIMKPDRKRSRWTREEDDRLKNLKTRGWCWWEIEQQFPL
ncbi:hypothetical protein AJ78_07235 [Emergomyces pasteurianus Ep9510]|uniref:Myb-like domain-containing protein n=1 Tax=Emergomyces pasteurianus Ep9510 TaxID=1447872 RepID=A0A1J9P870_9EURO|nr:hypothetical protein AJ78_07235 [Emergomyces pasteurianus Ep9510]